MVLIKEAFGAAGDVLADRQRPANQPHPVLDMIQQFPG